MNNTLGGAFRFREPLDVKWMDRGNCKTLPTGDFFPGQGSDINQVAEAKAVCAGCEVRAECLQFALDNGEHFGIWGGTSERERRQMRSARLGPTTPHGTRARYQRGCRCSLCRAANTQDSRRRRHG